MTLKQKINDILGGFACHPTWEGQEESLKAILEAVKECVPKESTYNDWGGESWNACREETLKNIEGEK